MSGFEETLDLWTSLAEILIQQHRYYEAYLQLDKKMKLELEISSSQQHATLQAAYADSFFDLSIELFRKGEVHRTLEVLKRCVGLGPASANCKFLIQMSMVYRSQRKLHLALRHGEMALEAACLTSQSAIEPHLAISQVLSELGRHEASLNHARAALILSHKESRMQYNCYMNVGVECEYIGRLDEAISNFRLAYASSCREMGKMHAMTRNVQRILTDLVRKKRDLGATHVLHSDAAAGDSLSPTTAGFPAPGVQEDIDDNDDLDDLSDVKRPQSAAAARQTAAAMDPRVREEEMTMRPSITSPRSPSMLPLRASQRPGSAVPASASWDPPDPAEFVTITIATPSSKRRSSGAVSSSGGVLNGSPADHAGRPSSARAMAMAAGVRSPFVMSSASPRSAGGSPPPSTVAFPVSSYADILHELDVLFSDDSSGVPSSSFSSPRAAASSSSSSSSSSSFSASSARSRHAPVPPLSLFGSSDAAAVSLSQRYPVGLGDLFESSLRPTATGSPSSTPAARISKSRLPVSGRVSQSSASAARDRGESVVLVEVDQRDWLRALGIVAAGGAERGGESRHRDLPSSSSSADAAVHGLVARSSISDIYEKMQLLGARLAPIG